MSKIGCQCGHVISDNMYIVPYKSSLLKDSDKVNFFDWVTGEIQSYVLAVQASTATQWLLDRGYGKDYVDLNLDHGNVLHDHIYSHYLGFNKDVYECEQCGRLHIQTKENLFSVYSPDSMMKNK
jgi:hypothetical protein